jgi:hypothetical protein
LGVLSALPLISSANICCCLWVVTGGVVAAYLLQQQTPAPITPADGALVGLLAGGIGACVFLVVSIPVTILIGPLEQRMLSRLFETMGNVPPEFREYTTTSLATGVRFVLGFAFMLVAGAVFSTIGGVLGAMVFVRKVPPPVIDTASST